MTSGFIRLICMFADTVVFAAWVLIAFAPVVVLLVALRISNQRQRKRSKHLLIPTQFERADPERA